MRRDVNYHRKDARNIVWGVGFVGFLPTFVILLIMFTQSRRHIVWGGVQVGVLAYSVVLAALSAYAGFLCGKGSRAGRRLAAIPSFLVLLSFPLGTIFGIAALIRLTRSEIAESLASQPEPSMADQARTEAPGARAEAPARDSGVRGPSGIVKCPSCGTVVLPKSNGTCPSCRREMPL